jgi:DNA-binding CsgD family transcriptional regulator
MEMRLMMPSSDFDAKSYSAYNYNVSIEDAVVDLCEPLTYLNIDSFVFQRIFLKENEPIAHFTISNNVPWVKQHLLNCNYLGKSFLDRIHKANIGLTKCYSWQVDPNNPKGLPESGILTGFNVYEPKGEYLEVSSFCSKMPDHSLMHNCVNHLDSLKKFITYFKTQAGDLINTSDNSKISYFKEIYEPVDLNAPLLPKANLDIFLEKIKLNKFYLGNGNPLSKREIECVALLSQRKSLKETASLLKISPRTVEAYLNTVKSKTGCTTSQIINLFLKSEYNSFLR